MANKYRVGDVLYENVYPQNSIPWYKEQLYTVANYNPKKKQYMLKGTADKYPRFFTEQDLDITFRFRYKC